MTSAITTLSDNQTHEVVMVMNQTIVSITQSHLDYNKRSLTAKNYAVAIAQYKEFAQASGFVILNYSALEAWRYTMLADGYAISIINTKLASMCQFSIQPLKTLLTPF